MEAIKINSNDNIIDSYGLKPSLFYDIEGIVINKEGKNVKVEKTIEDKKVYYSLRLKQDLNIELGQKVVISKDNIQSMKIEKKKDDFNITVDEAINKLGLEETDEAKEAIENLIENGIPITRENLESFLSSKRYLKEIIENLDFDSCIKLLDKNINLKEDSLQKIAQALSEIKGNSSFSIKEILKSSRKLSYEEAEQIAVDIYGRKMGKDVYDTIIALHKEKIPVNKENIERVMEVVDKLYDLKRCDDEVFVKVLEKDLVANIETLYKLKHSYKIGSIEENTTSLLYEQFTVEREASIEDILNILMELDMDNNKENIQLVREFLLNEVELNKTNIEIVINMKNDLKKLISLANEENIAHLIEEGVDPLKEDISVLVDLVKDKENRSTELSSPKTSDILNKLEGLKSITDKELLLLIKNGEDFKIDNLQSIVDTGIGLGESLDSKTAEKAITISNIFNTLGNLDSDTIALASKRYSYLTLNNLYEAHNILSNEGIKVSPISESQENLIRQEYLNIRNNTTINLIRESIKEQISIENMPLEELNEYIDNKTFRYRETNKFLNELGSIKGSEESIIPIVMKNNLNMSLGKINDINSMLNSGKGIGSAFYDLQGNREYYSEDIKKGIEILEKRIKKFTTSLKEGDGNIKENYKDMMDGFQDLDSSFNDEDKSNEYMNRMREYLDLQNSLDDLVLQLPISLGEKYSNVNLIIPDIKKGIDEKNMVFFLSLNTDNLGEVKLSLQVKNREIYVDFEAESSDKILDNRHILEDGLAKLGYSLKRIQYSEL